MSLAIVIIIAVGLAMDAFAVALATSIGLKSVSRRQVFRFAFHFGLFQAFMPVIGWTLGRSMHKTVQMWDHWVAFGLLTFVGSKAIYEALHRDDGAQVPVSDPTKGLSLVMLSTATSIDALAVGFSFAMLEVAIWYPVLVIGLVTATLTTIAMLGGARLGARFGRRVEVCGGALLIGIGLKILIEHLAF